MCQNCLGYFKLTIHLLTVFLISNLSCALGTVLRSNILLFKLCWRSFNLTQITLGCKCHVMSLDVGVKRRALCGLPSGKNGGLSCFPHLVRRVHSADNNIIVYQGKTALAFTGFLSGQDRGLDDACVGTLLNVNGRSPPLCAQAYYCYAVSFNEKRKKHGAFE